jgi:hypothetical protein
VPQAEAAVAVPARSTLARASKSVVRMMILSAAATLGAPRRHGLAYLDVRKPTSPAETALLELVSCSLLRSWGAYARFAFPPAPAYIGNRVPD